MTAVAQPVDRNSLVTPARVAAFALLGALLFTGVRLAAHDWSPHSFARVGDRFSVVEEVPAEFEVQADDVGYDGQFFYRLAREPFSTAERVDGIAFDRAAYRNARIGYPILAWTLSAGGWQPLVPWALILVNVLAIAAVAGFTAALARDVGQSPWYGLAAAAWPGLTVALSFDLAEPVEAAFLLATLLALRRRRWALAAGLLTFAVLTRETALVFAGALLVVSVVDLLRRLRAPDLTVQSAVARCAVAIAPMLAYGIGQVVMARRWAGGRAGAAETADFLTTPGTAIVRQVSAFLSGGDAVDLYQLLQLVLIGLVVAIIARALLESGATRWERIATLIGLVTLISLPTWDRMVVFLRYPDDFVHVGLIVVLAAPAARLPSWAKPEVLAKTIGILWVSTAVVWAGGL